MSVRGPSDELPTEDDTVLAAEYVLGLMSDDEIRHFEDRLSEDETLLKEVAHWTEHLTAVAGEVPEAAPPSRAKRRIEAAVFGTDAAPPVRGIWRFIAPLGLGGAAAAGMVWAALTLGLFSAGAPEPELVADIAVEDPVLAIHAGWFDESDELLVIREAGEVSPDSDLELWVIAGSDAPVSLGLVPQDGDRIRYVLPPDVSDRLAGATLAVSLEPRGGSPTGAPTGPVLGTAPITVY